MEVVRSERILDVFGKMSEQYQPIRGYERKSGVKDKSEDFGLSIWKDETAICNMGEIIGEAELRENLRSSVLIMAN